MNLNITDDFPSRVKALAETLFRRDFLNCAESVFKAVLEESGNPCSHELLSCASSFGRGMGGAGCCCGALIGGEMAIGYLFGRNHETGKYPKDFFALPKELHDRFVEHNRVTCCRILHKGKAFGSKEQLDDCAIRTAEAAEIVGKLILQKVKG